MTKNYRIVIRFSVSLLALAMVSGTAQARSSEDSTVPQAAAGEAGLEEIIVTARRRAENLQAVPISVTGLSNDVLREKHVARPLDIQYLTPSLSVQDGSFNRLYTGYAIRGQSSQGTIIYRSEVPSLVTPLAVPYYDLSSIQVLKGPQGTLFGGSTTGGAALIYSAKPTDRLGGYVEGSLGNLVYRDLEAMLNVPIVENHILLRVAGKITRRDGYTANLFTGQDLDNQRTESGRVSLTVKPTDTITNDLVYEYNHRRERSGNTIAFLCNPNGTINQATGGAWFPLCQAQQALGPRKVKHDLDGLGIVKQHFLANITTFEVSDTITLKNIFGYIDQKTGNRNDSDGTTLPAIQTTNPYPQYLLNRVKQISDEFQIQGKSFDGNMNWILGGFFSKVKNPDFDHLFVATVPLPAGLVANIVSKSRATEKAIFAQATYNLDPLVEGVSLTGGIRHTWNNEVSLSGTNICLVLPKEPACGFPPTVPFSTANLNLGLTRINPKTEATTYNLTIDYKASDDLLFYAAHRKGYRRGGVFPFAPPGFGEYRPETVGDFELGIKSSYSIAGVTGRLNASIYSSNYKNIQRTSQVGPATGIIINAEKARIQGVEIEAALIPAEWLKLDANYAYLDAKFIKYVDPINHIDLSATRFPLAPRHALGATATFIVPAPQEIGQISLSANYAYRSTTYFSVQGFQPEAKQKGYGLLNLQAQWRSVRGAPIDISLFAKNVTNKVFIAGTGNLSFNPNPFPTTGIDSVFYAEPRTYGVSMRFRFGGEGE